MFVYRTMRLVVFFFFSSRRRHTRFDCDWSSDVCSSDLEFWYGLVGLAGIGQNFDGNGTFTHFLLGGGGPTIRSGQTGAQGKSIKGLRLLAHASLPPQGTRPAFPASEPPYKPLETCYKQA